MSAKVCQRFLYSLPTLANSLQGLKNEIEKQMLFVVVVDLFLLCQVFIQVLMGILTKKAKPFIKSICKIFVPHFFFQSDNLTIYLNFLQFPNSKVSPETICGNTVAVVSRSMKIIQFDFIKDLAPLWSSLVVVQQWYTLRREGTIRTRAIGQSYMISLVIRVSNFCFFFDFLYIGMVV